MTVHRYLVTGDAAQRMEAWMPVAGYTNWIEGRENGADRETWLVTGFAEHRVPFLAAAKAAGVTVEEIEGAGDDETYRLLVGEPGSGWTPEAQEQYARRCAEAAAVLTGDEP